MYFSFVLGSPAYDSVRPLSYQEADVFLLCYKISDPISLYNVKNKWIRELRRQRPDVPVILCGCQSDLRNDQATLNHLSKTGRTPVSSDQALAICCEIQAVNYVETSAKFPLDNNAEAFELCALAAIKKKGCNNNKPAFRRSPSINSSLSLFEPLDNNNSSAFLKKGHQQQLRHSYRHYASCVAPPPLNSPSSFSECDARLSTFSPEPLRLDQPRIPPSILENEAYQSDSTNVSISSFQTFQKQVTATTSRPSSIYSDSVENVVQQQQRPQRPTSLFKTPLPNCYSPQTLITPSGDPKKRLLGESAHNQTMLSGRRFDSLSELNGGGHSAMIRPNCLTRRTSYRTYQKVPIPVAAPMSPIGSDYSFDLKSPTSSQCFSPVPPSRLEAVTEDIEASANAASCTREKIFEKTYESLKSTCSSQNSSKASSTASAASSADLSTYKLRLLDSSGIPDTEDPNLIKSLNFVSPKTGVYRPLPDRRYKQSCNVM